MPFCGTEEHGVSSTHDFGSFKKELFTLLPPAVPRIQWEQDLSLLTDHSLFLAQQRYPEHDSKENGVKRKKEWKWERSINKWYFWKAEEGWSRNGQTGENSDRYVYRKGYGCKVSACVWDITWVGLGAGDTADDKGNLMGGLFESLMVYFQGKLIGRVPRLGDRRPGGGTGWQALLKTVGWSEDGHTKRHDALGPYPPSAIRAPSWQERGGLVSKTKQNRQPQEKASTCW